MSQRLVPSAFTFNLLHQPQTGQIMLVMAPQNQPRDKAAAYFFPNGIRLIFTDNTHLDIAEVGTESLLHLATLERILVAEMDGDGLQNSYWATVMHTDMPESVPC